MSEIYPLAPEGVFLTQQGEGALLGLPMVFIRFAACPINCPSCDADYSLSSKVSLEEIVDKVNSLRSDSTVDWVWLTGGEPTVHELAPLVNRLHSQGFKVALATAGIKSVFRGSLQGGGVDFLSVSPHSCSNWMQRSGDQINLVPGLNNLKLADIEPLLDKCEWDFSHRFVTPFWPPDEDKPTGIQECIDFTRRRVGWKLGIQAQRYWGLQ